MEENFIDVAIAELGHNINLLEPTIGAEINNISIGEHTTSEEVGNIKRLLDAYKVLIFRDQHINADQQAKFAEKFGPIYKHPISKQNPSQPSVHRITIDDYKIPAKHRDRAHQTERSEQVTKGSSRPTWDGYHADTSWRIQPAWGLF